MDRKLHASLKFIKRRRDVTREKMELLQAHQHYIKQQIRSMNLDIMQECILSTVIENEHKYPGDTVYISPSWGNEEKFHRSDINDLAAFIKAHNYDATTCPREEVIDADGKILVMLVFVMPLHDFSASSVMDVVRGYTPSAFIKVTRRADADPKVQDISRDEALALQLASEEC